MIEDRITDTVQSVFTGYNVSIIPLMHRPDRSQVISVMCTLANLLTNCALNFLLG